MQLEYDNRRTRENPELTAAQAVEQKSEMELFMEFYELQKQPAMSQNPGRVCAKYHPGGERMKPKKLVISAFGLMGKRQWSILKSWEKKGFI